MLTPPIFGRRIQIRTQFLQNLSQMAGSVPLSKWRFKTSFDSQRQTCVATANEFDTASGKKAFKKNPNPNFNLRPAITYDFEKLTKGFCVLFIARYEFQAKKEKESYLVCVAGDSSRIRYVFLLLLTFVYFCSSLNTLLFG